MMKIVDFSRSRGIGEPRMPARADRRVLLLVFACMWCVLPLATRAQDLDARSPQPMPVGKQQRKAEKKKAKQQAELNKAIRKGKKQHEKLQSKQTKKMMKKSRKKSKRWNDNRREFFLKRWFSPKHRKADAGTPQDQAAVVFPVGHFHYYSKVRASSRGSDPFFYNLGVVTHFDLNLSFHHASPAVHQALQGAGFFRT